MRVKWGAAGIASFAALFVWIAFGTANVRAQKKEVSPPKTTRLTIVVTGGENNKPVAEASVYVKSVPGERVGKKGKKEGKFELNLKTNQEGETHSPAIPQAKVLIQVVAEKWKTFGEYYDLQQDNQTIQIHLERPTRFY